MRIRLIGENVGNNAMIESKSGYVQKNGGVIFACFRKF
jgi:hypothetical protein